MFNVRFEQPPAGSNRCKVRLLVLFPLTYVMHFCHRPRTFEFFLSENFANVKKLGLAVNAIFLILSIYQNLQP